MRFLKNLLSILLLFAIQLPANAQSPSVEEKAVSNTLDALHENASKADGEKYFSLFAPNAVFLGTDATERWPIKEFKKYAMARFEKGTGWTYHKKSRFIYLSEGKKTAWFDESLHNENYGDCRGSGVLVKIDGEWKIVQYNLTIPIPNALARKVVAMIREAEKK
ncbi:MAG: nuclear transport factor 2 family protein [bacterium]